jgi:hypothetical protein
MKTDRPSMVPYPVTTPSPGYFFLFHAEILAAMDHELVDFLKTAIIQEIIDAFPGGHFPLGVLLIDPFLTTAQVCFMVSSLKFTDFRFYIHFGLLGVYDNRRVYGKAAFAASAEPRCSGTVVFLTFLSVPNSLKSSNDGSHKPNFTRLFAAS